MIRLLLLLALALPASAAQFTETFDDANLPCTIAKDRTRTCSDPPPPVPVPPVVTGISCAGFAATRVVQAVVPANGTAFVRYYVNSRGGFGRDDALVIVFKAPPADPIFQIGVTHTGDQYGPQTTRTFSLSTKPCDFNSADTVTVLQSTVLALKLRTNDVTTYSRIKLVPGQVYYLNVKQSVGGQNNCGGAGGRCDVYVSILNNAP